MNRGRAYLISLAVAAVLAVFTLLEYWVAIEYDSAIILMLIALIKAVIVIYAYMHVNRLWSTEEGH
jgi:hypothetical protein